MRLIDADVFKAALEINAIEYPGRPVPEWAEKVIAMLDETPEEVVLERDGTLRVPVENSEKVKRVMVLEDGAFYGTLYYAD